MEYRKTPEYWRKKLNIIPGMSKQEALEKFLDWQKDKKTCIRCEENEYKYKDFCDLYLICKEVENGIPNGQLSNHGEKSCRGSWGIQTNTFKITPKRLSVDKYRRQSVLL